MRVPTWGLDERGPANVDVRCQGFCAWSRTRRVALRPKSPIIHEEGIRLGVEAWHRGGQDAIPTLLFRLLELLGDHAQLTIDFGRAQSFSGKHLPILFFDVAARGAVCFCIQAANFAKICSSV